MIIVRLACSDGSVLWRKFSEVRFTVGRSKKINTGGVGAGLAPARTRPDHSGRPQGHAPTHWGT